MLNKLIVAITGVLGVIYQKVYFFLCGTHPYQNILHDEWLSLKDINRDLYRLSPHIKGKVLDIGCGSKPYSTWFPKASEYIGLDVWNNPEADIIISENQPWPISNNSIDCIVSFQTFEHIKDIKFVLREIDRVLKPGGTLLLTMPFIAYEHGAPSDYQRYTKNGIQQLLPHYIVKKVIPQGGFGSCQGTLSLRFIRISMLSNTISKLIWLLSMPIWMLVTLFINICGFILDNIDKTGNFYPNILLMAKKPNKQIRR